MYHTMKKFLMTMLGGAAALLGFAQTAALPAPTTVKHPEWSRNAPP